MSARPALLVIAVLAGAAGCAYNPATFPYWLPPGSVDQTHAKPRGPGYFRNFDPKACRLEVKPNDRAAAPLGAQLVLVATVYDKDGQPRRDRRVEWMLDGPGNIVEADESGLTGGRGYKVDNKYAVTYTSYVPKKITRGNDDPKDDVPVEPGQTFVVISSAVAGETVVTAYAPEVFNWDNGRVVTKVLWGESRFTFPAPSVVRVGGETTLTTSANLNAADARGDLRVRYRIIDGPTAVLVPGGGAAGGTSLTGTGGKEAEASLDANGTAAVRLVQRDRQQGKTHVAVEVVKPAEDGTGPGTVVGRRETTVEWAVPDVRLKVTGPPVAGAAGPFPVTVALGNSTGVDSKDARVRVTLSGGAALASSEPPPNELDDKGGYIFELPPVAGKAKQVVELQVRPAQVGDVTVAADVVTGDGLQASTKSVTRVEKGKLTLVLDAPPAPVAGAPIPVRAAVTNGAGTPAEHVTVWAQVDPGLAPSSGTGPVELDAGTLAPGQTKTLDLPLTAKDTGRYKVQAAATADGDIAVQADPLVLNVRRAELAVAVGGPQLLYLDQPGEWTFTVVNRGDAAVSNVVVRAAPPPELKVTAADGGKVAPGSVEWKLGDLAAGTQKSFKLSGEGAKLAPQASVAVTAQGDASGTKVGAKASSGLAVIGSPALSLQLTPPTGVVEVGKRVRYQIRVVNQGTVLAQNVEVTVTAPPELKPIRGSGGSADARIDGSGLVTFPIVEELRPGQTLSLTVEVEAAKAGDARLKAEVKAAHLKASLTEEQAARITAK